MTGPNELDFREGYGDAEKDIQILSFGRNSLYIYDKSIGSLVYSHVFFLIFILSESSSIDITYYCSMIDQIIYAQ